MRVLMVEGDLQIGRNLFRALKEAHYTVDWIRHGKTDNVNIVSTCYAAVLLDLGPSAVGGMNMLMALRAAGNPVPVLSLTARDDPDMRVRSLDVGADDCMLKSVDVPELLARLRAVLRRRAGCATSRIGDESLGLDLQKRTLYCNGVASALSAREFALMHCFLERPGAILSRRQLEDRIYGWGREVESNSLDVLIHSIRKKFGQSLIRNVRGLGWTTHCANESLAA
ncbi:response regulator transcription factor [Caballeronia humi]|uniref:Two component transcriptional regulator n=1 Tax=Caballeronia humi TaxID=326474 RepID=A0A158H732_9BURK|nr:response regulator transcription factor [Caballeronia humi]SAL39967.1 two component transcriptional regulator [Caballeronia humi]